ncbi:hypothetical protein [Hyphomicrobium sp.]|uniref:hypothetical protein n=1 Tax=Hyphomicrobium sp. TaxID=82 RepID=UPI001D920B5E|nr:hypothetical protein [Hyphomicrobium sp.]MBY0560036.1 hypothetical protein [Hyphomicrobium sp.]
MASIPYLSRRNQHRIGAAGRKSEKKLAKRLGGRARPASGAMVGAKGDIDLKTILLEAKSTTNSQIALKLGWLMKIAHEARCEGKDPALSVSFVHDDGEPVRDGQWVLVPMSLWEEKLT